MAGSSLHGTTIVGVKYNGEIALAGDGQVTFGESVMLKGNARKVRRIDGGNALCGFAGSTSDAFTLESRFEAKLKEFHDLARAAVELAREWRLDKMLRNLDAMLLCADKERILLISGRGDIIEPEHDVIAIGSGGPYAFAAARGLMHGIHWEQSVGDAQSHSKTVESLSVYTAAAIAKKSIEIAADICVFTNQSIIVETIS